MQIKAVEALLRRDGKLPVNVKFLIEGEEETGRRASSRSLCKVENPPRLHADAAVICDTEMFAPKACPPSAWACAAWSTAKWSWAALAHDLHSGVYGGAAPNPIQAIDRDSLRS